jgi:hypothetical protein
MRGNKVQGRFKIDFETLSMDEGIVDELRDPVGTTVKWWTWDPTALAANYGTWVDPIYDVSSQEGNQGRRWNDPFDLPVIMAQQIRSTNVMNERGFYVTDTLRLVVAVDDLNRLIPDIVDNPTDHIKDRVVFQRKVFVPTRVLPRGRYKERYAVVTIDCNQVNAEELVNDPQFQSLPYQSAETVNTNIEYGFDGYGTGEYGL